MALAPAQVKGKIKSIAASNHADAYAAGISFESVMDSVKALAQKASIA